MHRQPVRCDRHQRARQPARHHPPANRPLQATQSPDPQQPPGPARWNATREQKPGKTCKPHQTDDPAQLPVPPFPPIKQLEIGQRHALGHQLILRDRLIPGEFGVPCGGIPRWQGTTERLPFGDRQARVAQPRQAADGDHQRHQQEQSHQPAPHPAPRAPAHSVDHAAPGLHPWLIRPHLYEQAALGHRLLHPRQPRRQRAPLQAPPSPRPRAICRNMP